MGSVAQTLTERKRDPGLSASVLKPHMPGIDVLRGVAILMVITFHGFYYSASQFPWHNIFAKILYQSTSGGWAGVNLFFALSGFLITGNLMDSEAKKNYYARFYARRALRILPIYFLILLTLGLLGWRARSTFFYAVSFWRICRGSFFMAPICPMALCGRWRWKSSFIWCGHGFTGD